ncbi:hypothetical protein SCLCIDRAFT_324910 [Scleroderma citrinum Foug A]|uniref:DNAJ-containing protein X-domain domain-containing protein n=1 Tax=Scleroderma citrinum Foug A TaxID=1036808 RepID=A0A0C3EEZ5_9AGAM|nr:hypothetical protein SCLCIDRAFT_324910 [Scleroderma citrinum Foug A]
MSDESMDMKLWSSQRIRMAYEAEELRSKSFGMEVLRTVSAVYQKSSEFIYRHARGEERVPDMARVYDVRCKIRSLVQNVKYLEGKLTATHADDKRRTLEEDITGRILLACWQGIRSEIEQIVEKVIRMIVNDKRVERQEREERSKYVQQDGRVLETAIVEAPDYDQSHLRRILADAEAGISKYDLLMASRLAERSGQLGGLIALVSGVLCIICTAVSKCDMRST